MNSPPKNKNSKNLRKNFAIENSTRGKSIINESISKINIDKYKQILEYNANELNSLSYKEALKVDQRNYSAYYCSLLRKNQLIIFSFFSNKDYNSQIIKMFLFFFFFSLNLVANALFFTDDTMHKIYVGSGSYNLNIQIPKIIYSSLISIVISIIIKYLSLTEKQIIKFKQSKIMSKLDIQFQKLLLELKIKFILFSLIAFILLLFFCFYIACFCGIYINTQLHLIKDTIISLCLSLLYPFVIYLIPGIFRIKALHAVKKDKECMYRFSKILQSI